jgi:hypothetical protein
MQLHNNTTLQHIVFYYVLNFGAKLPDDAV